MYLLGHLLAHRRSEYETYFHTNAANGIIITVVMGACIACVSSVLTCESMIVLESVRFGCVCACVCVCLNVCVFDVGVAASVGR